MSLRGPDCYGFKLKKLYPGCRRKLGSFEPLTTGELFQWSEFWEPQYRTGRTVKVTLTNGTVLEPTMGVDCYLYKDTYVPMMLLNEIVAKASVGHLGSYEITYPLVDIGCIKGIPISEIRKLIAAFNEHGTTNV